MAAQLDLFGNPIAPATSSKPVKKQKETILQKPQQIYVEELPEKEDTKLNETMVDVVVDSLPVEKANDVFIEEVVEEIIIAEEPTVFVEEGKGEENSIIINEVVVAAETIIENESISVIEKNKEEIAELVAIEKVVETFKEPVAVIEENTEEETILEFSLTEQKVETTILENKPNAVVAISKTQKEKVEKRGRKSYKEIDATADLINIPSYEILEQKLYYSIGEVATWFNVNTSQIRFWENEFDIIKPRKTKKGDRLFRVEDIKNLELIHHLLRVKKLSIQGAKDYLKANKKNANLQFALSQSLHNFKNFLLELKANL